MKETIGGQILTAKGIVICVLLLPVMFSSGAAEVLFELISPNEEYLGEFGCAVSGAGDINGDGYGDFIIGACSESSPSRVDFAGRTYLIDGLTGKLQQTLTSTNPDICGQFGCAVSGAGDINGDGYDDVIVGAHGEYPGGRVYAYDGLTGDVIQWFLSPNPAQYLGGFGYSVSGIGDVDGDGHNDVLIGAPHDHESGRVYIFERDSHGMPRTLISPNEEETGNFGCSVSYVGDTDGDECDDIVVGAWAEDPGISPELAGRAYVFDGYSGILRHTIISPNEEENGGFGNVVSGAGDVNGDGYADVIVGAWREDPGSAPDNAGRAYVYDGHTGDLIHSLISPNEQEAGRFGNAVSSAGDVNGDGYADVLVGTFGESQEGSPDGAGIAYIFDGKTGKMIHKLVSPNEEDGGEFGSAVSGESAAGDGPLFVVVGAQWEDPGTSPGAAGRAYVFSWMNLAAELSGSSLKLQWIPWFPAYEYWIYGAENTPYFQPGLAPGYAYKLDEVSASSTVWSGDEGVGDSYTNWTYLIIAVNPMEEELARTNRSGEWDFGLDIPDSPMNKH